MNDRDTEIVQEAGEGKPSGDHASPNPPASRPSEATTSERWRRAPVLVLGATLLALVTGLGGYAIGYATSDESDRSFGPADGRFGMPEDGQAPPGFGEGVPPELPEGVDPGTDDNA